MERQGPRKLGPRPEEMLTSPVTKIVTVPVGQERPRGILLKEIAWACCFPDCPWTLPPATPLHQAATEFGDHLLSSHPFEQFEAKLGRRLEFRIDPRAIDARKR